MRIIITETITLSSNPSNGSITLPIVDGAKSSVLYLNVLAASNWTNSGGSFPALSAGLQAVDPSTNEAVTISGLPIINQSPGPSAGQSIEFVNEGASLDDLDNAFSHFQINWSISGGGGTNGSTLDITIEFSG